MPDTDRCLSELFRVLRPGGRVYLQVPLWQARTTPPPGVEYHEDHSLVYWRFDWDVADSIRQPGSPAPCSCRPSSSTGCVRGGWTGHVTTRTLDVADVLAGADAADLTPVADERSSRRYGFEPAFMFVTWECVRPG